MKKQQIINKKQLLERLDVSDPLDKAIIESVEKDKLKVGLTKLKGP
jgi:hypothetical protein